jgi:hypothetical protein
MKNIHLLPTDKPSYLYKMSDSKLYLSDLFEKGSSAWINQHIYITSDEEIKEGFNQWYLDKFLNKPRNSSGSQYGENQDVIILTTDQDLIKDGVQAIDDEFLQWFVNNPSCEEVEIEKVYDKLYVPVEELMQYRSQPKEMQFDHSSDIDECYYYKIIILKDEPKQETLENITLEEVAEKYAELSYYNRDEVNAFVNGAKWQSKRMYSEEEMYDLFAQWIVYQEGFPRVDEDEIPNGFMSFNEWFEQFKKNNGKS